MHLPTGTVCSNHRSQEGLCVALLLSQASTQDLQPEEDVGLTLNPGVPEGIWKRCTGPMFLDFPWTVFSVARLRDLTGRHQTASNRGLFSPGMVGTSSGLEPAPGSLPDRAVVLEARRKACRRQCLSSNQQAPFQKPSWTCYREVAFGVACIEEWPGLWSADPLRCHSLGHLSCELL